MSTTHEYAPSVATTRSEVQAHAHDDGNKCVEPYSRGRRGFYVKNSENDPFPDFTEEALSVVLKYNKQYPAYSWKEGQWSIDVAQYDDYTGKTLCPHEKQSAVYYYSVISCAYVDDENHTIRELESVLGKNTGFSGLATFKGWSQDDEGSSRSGKSEFPCLTRDMWLTWNPDDELYRSYFDWSDRVALWSVSLEPQWLNKQRLEGDLLERARQLQLEGDGRFGLRACIDPEPDKENEADVVEAVESRDGASQGGDESSDVEMNDGTPMLGDELVLHAPRLTMED